MLSGSSKIAKRFANTIADIASEAREIKQPLFLRLGLCLEELSEWLTAHAEGDVFEAADAIADRLFVLFGDAVETGLPLTVLFEAVAESNHSKVANTTSKDGKGLKGRDYVDPKDRIRKIIAECQFRGAE